MFFNRFMAHWGQKDPCYCSKLNNFRNFMFFEIKKFEKFVIL